MHPALACAHIFQPDSLAGLRLWGLESTPSFSPFTSFGLDSVAPSAVEKVRTVHQRCRFGGDVRRTSTLKFRNRIAQIESPRVAIFVEPRFSECAAAVEDSALVLVAQAQVEGRAFLEAVDAGEMRRVEQVGLVEFVDQTVLVRDLGEERARDRGAGAAG